MKTINEALEALKECMRNGMLTPASHIDSETVVCFSELQSAGGLVYHQHPFDTLPVQFQAMLKHRTKGERIGPLKVLAVFDSWAPENQPMVSATVRHPH